VLGHLVKLVSDRLVIVDDAAGAPDQARLDAVYRAV
jgi:hypothetical protein